MKIFLYNCLVLILLPAMVVRIVFKSLKDKDYGLNFLQRFGIYNNIQSRDATGVNVENIYIYNSDLNTSQALEKIVKDFNSQKEVSVIVDFIKNSSRGLI